MLSLHFETHELSDKWVNHLLVCANEVEPLLKHNPEIVICGRVCHQHRSIGFFSDESEGYRYSNQIAKSKPLTKNLSDLLSYVNKKFNAKFNGILVNKYSGGNDYIGKHSDDVRALDKDAGVIAMSVGAVRKFRIRDKKTGKIIQDIPTSPNIILQMKGDFQMLYTHEIPIEKKIQGTRFSFTFRCHTE